MFGLLRGMVSKVAKLVTGGGGKTIATVGAGALAGTVAGDALSGFASSVPGGRKRRRRTRKRLTDREISELITLKAIVGQRSPLVLIAGLKMLGRG